MSVSNIPGDLFRFRHDTVKTVLNSFCLTSNIRAECEVYGLFRDLIPVEALAAEEDLQSGRGRHGLLPDFRIEIPTPETDLQNLRYLVQSRNGTPEMEVWQEGSQEWTGESLSFLGSIKLLWKSLIPSTMALQLDRWDH